MHSFRLRLILVLMAGVTILSTASTYFEVLAHKHALRQELEWRSSWMGASLKPEMERALAQGNTAGLSTLTADAKEQTGALGVGIYDPQGQLISSSGAAEVFQSLAHVPFERLTAKTQVPSPFHTQVERSIQKGAQVNAFGHTGKVQWLEEVLPLHNGSQVVGALAILIDSSYIQEQGYGLWRRSFWWIVATVLLIAGVTFLMVRWFLMKPLMRVADRLRRLRMGHFERGLSASSPEFAIFSPLAREVETMAESLIAARAAAAAEARLRDAGEHYWTPERLAVHMKTKASGRIFVVSNREPYMHVREGKKTLCVVPPSGLVTAIEPVLRACDGVWVASGSGNADRENVDQFDRLRVPPDDPRYTLRRVWLSPEEESAYYDGFANEGLWPLCHIAHTRPIFRASDWEAYQLVNEKFAAALLDEMNGSAEPLVFVQDYHFALLPRLVKTARPDARVAIFWHIPWPNPEAFGICPWQAQLLDGLLGADLIGFHIPQHCHNFLATVDRVLESRTDREHMTARRHGHSTLVKPYPVSVAFSGGLPGSWRVIVPQKEEDRAAERSELLEKFGVEAETIAVGVDRLDYTKGIVERLLALEALLKEHPWHRERLTLVQIAAPSRTRIPSYAELRKRVEEEVHRINLRYQTSRWKPIILIDRQCDHEEVNRWYRVADVCLVTSLHDGMNLVAKEYVASRDDEDGVLVLSKFTGAAVELRDALIVNPYDTEEVAEAIHRGLDMPREERRLRMQQMRRYVMEHNIYRWAAMVLGDLGDVRLENMDSETQIAPTAEPISIDPYRKLA
ncbi:MAG TPA: trehalose-6-phosphate synthase [Terracidiphilus sp.]|nr:trehalose-6-phosphate synthase [Terracidiphilus sp.]